MTKYIYSQSIHNSQINVLGYNTKRKLKTRKRTQNILDKKGTKLINPRSLTLMYQSSSWARKKNHGSNKKTNPK